MVVISNDIFKSEACKHMSNRIEAACKTGDETFMTNEFDTKGNDY
jgi:hypothetical protein